MRFPKEGRRWRLRNPVLPRVRKSVLRGIRLAGPWLGVGWAKFENITISPLGLEGQERV